MSSLPKITAPTGKPAATTSPPQRYCEPTIRQFWDLVKHPQGCVEMAILSAKQEGGRYIPAQDYATPFSGYYDDLEAFVADAKKLNGVGGYATVNPVNDALMARSCNKFKKIGKGSSRTADADIVTLAGIYIDFDPKRPSDISSTDAELAAAVAMRDQVLDEFPELAAASFWGKSGNGAYIRPRIDLPNNSVSTLLVKSFLHGLAAFGASIVDIATSTPVDVDTSTFNHARLMRLVGTLNCKGDSIPTRPHRLSTIDGVGGGETLSEEFLARVARLKEGPTSTTVNVPATIPMVRPGDAGDSWAMKATSGDVESRAIAYLKKVPGAIAGQKGHNQTLAAAAIGPKFDLSPETTLRLLVTHYNPRCEPVWSERDLQHKIDDAFAITSDRGKLLVKDDRPARGKAKRGAAKPAGELADLPANVDPITGVPLTGSDIEIALTYGFHDSRNAQRLVERSNGDLRYRVPDNDWVSYDGKRWEADTRMFHVECGTRIAAAVMTEMPPTRSQNLIDAFQQHVLTCHSRRTIEDAIKLAKPVLATNADRFDSNQYLLNVQNGTIDLETRKFRSHDKMDLITSISPIAYDPDAKCPKFMKFLGDITGGNTDLAFFLKRAVGYSATSSVQEQALFLLHGDGANGKSVFLNVMQKVLGDYACTVRSELLTINQNEDHPTGLTDLEGKRMVATIEVGDGKRLAEALVKSLTGGDKIRARKMRQDFHEFHPTFKLWLAANHRPEIKGLDHGIWRRIKLVPFTVKIPKDQQTPDLDKILVRDEGPGILNWILEGVADWREVGLDPPAIVEAATEEYRVESDQLGEFLTLVLEPPPCLPDGTENKGRKMAAWTNKDGKPNEEYKLRFSDIYRDYATWCEEGNLRGRLNAKAMGQELKRRGYGTYEGRGVWKTGMKLKIVPNEDNGKPESSAESDTDVQPGGFDPWKMTSTSHCRPQKGYVAPY